MKGNINSNIQSSTPVLVDFYAEWCGPCKVQSPILSEVAWELNSKLKVIKINIDKNQGIAARFQIRGVPTLSLFKNGEVLWHQSGFLEKAKLIRILKSYL